MLRLPVPIIGLIGIAAAILAAPPFARSEVAASDKAAIEAVITSQIDAFLRDDEAAAYGFASPGIKLSFPTVAMFMDMVKKGFQPVYRPRERFFGPLTEGPDGPLQRLFVTGPDGRNWVAEYILEKQPDGSWLIKGCRLLEDKGESI